MSLTFIQSFVLGQDTGQEGLFFKPDGLRMYTSGTQFDRIYEYNLGLAWNISTLQFSRSFTPGGSFPLPRRIYIREDGLRLFVLDAAGLSTLAGFSLSEAWNITTASIIQSKSELGDNVSGLFFKSDGSKTYVASDDDNTIREFALSSAWNVTTANLSFVLSVDGNFGFFIRRDGLQLFTTSSLNGGVVNTYTLPNAWTLQGGTLLESFSLLGPSPPPGTPTEVFFQPNGSKMFVISRADGKIYEYDSTISFPSEVCTPSLVITGNGQVQIVNADSNSVTLEITCAPNSYLAKVEVT